MVKGVNKTVIEVNNTGSKLFEKIVFYVSPQYGNTDLARLQKAAGEFSFHFSETGTYQIPLRRQVKLRRRRRFIAACVALLCAVALTVWLLK